MRVELGLRAGVAIPLLFTLVAGIAALLIFNYFTQVNLLKEEEERSIDMAVNTAQTLLDSATIHYQQMAAFVARIPEVQEAVNKRDRNRLIEKFLPSFNYLKQQFGVAQFHFHIPPAVSLLRMHELTIFGDDISKQRKSVVHVGENKKGVRGIEAGVGGVGLRGVEPIFYRDTYVGSVDLGGGFKEELELIKKAIKADAGVVINREILTEWPGLKDIKQKIGEWIPISSTLKEPTEFVMEFSLKQASQSGDKYHKEYITKAGKDFIVIYSPLKDFSGKKIGFLYIVKERVLAPSKIITMLAINIVVYAIMLIVMAILIGYGMNKFVINPIIALTKLADDISMGKTSQKVEIRDARGEIAILAKSIERMRVTMKKLLE